MSGSESGDPPRQRAQDIAAGDAVFGRSPSSCPVCGEQGAGLPRRHHPTGGLRTRTVSRAGEPRLFSAFLVPLLAGRFHELSSGASRRRR